MFLKRSKLAQQGLSSTVSPGFASSWQAATQSFIEWVVPHGDSQFVEVGVELGVVCAEIDDGATLLLDELLMGP